MNDRAFVEQIFETYHGRILGYIRGKIDRPGEAEDLTSEVFVKLCQNADRYDPAKASAATWVYTIARNVVIDYYRTRATYLKAVDPDGEAETVGVPDETDSRLLRTEMLDRLSDALAKLSQRERDLVLLHHYDRITLEELAVRMGMSYSNAKLVHRKALKKLQLLLGE